MKPVTTCGGSTNHGSRAGAPSHQNKTCLKINIDDLPENVLVEILCRLPYKFVVRCKCVCKSWSTLISLSYFQTRRALYLRANNCDENVDQILLSVETRRSGRQVRAFYTILKHSDRPVLESLKINPRNPEMNLNVVATYNDLILFCEGHSYYGKYHIYNPYTNQWSAVPPPNSYNRVGVGFICDSDHRCRIVRLLDWIRAEEPPFLLKVEVFSSETGKWTVSVVNFPRMCGLYSLKSTPALAYDGMLYWLGDGGFLVGLDPFSKLENNHHCRRFISMPPLGFDRECLGVCRGTMRLCRSSSPTYDRLTLSVWELKEEEGEEEVDGVGGKMMKWYLKGSVELRGTDLGQQLLALDPNDEDIIYLKRNTWTKRGDKAANIVTFNIRTRKVIDIRKKLPCSDFLIEAFPFVLPWWQWRPTPVPRLLECQTRICRRSFSRICFRQ